MSKRILITGINGQLGNEIRLIATQYSAFSFYFTDIDTLNVTDKEAVARFVNDNAIDYIVNCAAYTAVDRAEEEVELCYKINSEAVANLAEAALGKARIIHISTDYVFPGTGSGPLKETDETNPASVYGKSKLEGEQRLIQILPDSIIIRTAWLYSAFGTNFVKTMIRLGNEKESINVVSDQQGTPTYAADLAAAIMDIIIFSEEKNTFLSGIYHYSNEGETTWADFAAKIMELKNPDCRVCPIPTSAYPTKAARPMYSVLDKSKIKQTFSIRIPRWEESLERCIDKL